MYELKAYSSNTHHRFNFSIFILLQTVVVGIAGQVLSFYIYNASFVYLICVFVNKCVCVWACLQFKLIQI